MDVIKEYQNVSSDDDQLSFRISRTEDMWKDQGGTSESPHRHGFYTVILLQSGTGIHTIDYTQYVIHPQTLFFVSPGQVHEFVADEKPHGYALFFSTEFLLNNGIEISFLNELHLFNDYGEAPPFALTAEQLSRLSHYSEEMIALGNSTMPHQEEAMSAFLKLFLLYVHGWFFTEDRQVKQKDSKSNILRGFKNMVEHHFTEWHNTSLYAKELGVSPDHLNRIIKQLIGKTAKEYLQSRIIVEAQRLLTFSTLSAKEISYELGFSEPGNFSSFFKKRIGISPSQFKKSLNIGNS